MHQYNVTWMSFRNNTLYNIVYTFIHPIQRVCIPLNNGVFFFLGNFQHLLIKITIRHPN